MKHYMMLIGEKSVFTNTLVDYRLIKQHPSKENVPYTLYQDLNIQPFKRIALIYK